MSERQVPYRAAGIFPPPDPQGIRYQQADALAVAALNAVDPTTEGWAANPNAVIADVIMLMVQAQQILFERERNGYPDRREPT